MRPRVVRERKGPGVGREGGRGVVRERKGSGEGEEGEW